MYCSKHQVLHSSIFPCGECSREKKSAREAQGLDLLERRTFVVRDEREEERRQMINAGFLAGIR